jgi:hypothetical protein
MMAVTILEKIPPPHRGTSSYPHQSLSSWTEMPSSSKCRESSLAFARGLRWWWTVAARLDFFSLSHGGNDSRGSDADPIEQIYLSGCY